MAAEERAEDRIRHRMGRCRFFNGVQNGVCEAGVRYDDVSPASGGIPCLISISERAHVNTCPARQWTTREEAEREVEAANKAIGEYFSDLEAERCPHCKRPIEKYDQVGRCVYAEPCGHRLYQGRAPKKGVA